MSNDPYRREEARVMDAEDPLRSVRDRFALPEDVIYLDGNSLGPLAHETQTRLKKIVESEWGHDLIRSWNNNDWITAPQRIGGKISSLIGADPDEVIATDSVSVNIFKLLTAIARRTPSRKKFISEAGNFPTDIHVAQGAADALGLSLRLTNRQKLLNDIDSDTAAVILTHVHYKTGERYDMASVNKLAEAADVPVLWDLSHSVGAVPLNMAASGTQFAVGCGYKYLNGGPGAPSFIYCASSEQSLLHPILQGWMGHAAPFSFQDEYQPSPNLNRFLVGTPPILSLLALESGVDQFADLSVAELWPKSVRMFEFFADLVRSNCPQLNLVTPVDPQQRGSHISFSHPNAWPVNNALIARGVIGDFRTPNVLRFGLTPLYTSFEELSRAVEHIDAVFSTGEWRNPAFSKPATVT